MASGTVGYTDTRSEKNYLGSIAKSIGNRLKQASNMASEERAYASKKAEDGGTSLEEAGIGKGYFFKRALGSRFGGDRIARTRGRLGATGPGKDPTKNYKQRFRGGFDYNVTNEIQSATVPLSGALVSGLRGVESGLGEVSQALTVIGTGMGNLARGQNDLAKATYFNGQVLRVMVTELKRQQSRIAGRREERSIERGRRALPGGGGNSGGIKGLLPPSKTPGMSGGGLGAVLDAANFGTGQAARTATSATKAGRAGTTGTRALLGNVPTARGVSSAIVKAGQSAGKFVPDVGLLAKNTASLLGAPAAGLRNLFSGTTRLIGKGAMFKSFVDVLRAQSAMGILGRGGAAAQLRSFRTGADDFLYNHGKGLAGDLARRSKGGSLLASLGYPIPGAMQKQTAEAMYDASRSIVDIPVNSSSADSLAKIIPNADAPAIAAARMASADNAGVKATEMATDAIVKKGTKEGLKRGGALSRMMVKQFGAAGTKSILKKIPVVAGIAGILFGIQRAMEGDFLGAGLEITSGLLGATGVGAPVGLAIDGFLLGRDLGAIPMAKGGLLTGKAPVNALMGEAGPEIVTPLNDETFIKFGEGFIDAAKRHKSEYSKILAAGNAEYFDKKPWWQGIVTGLENMLPKIEIKIPEITWPWQRGNNNSNPGGGRVRPGATAGSDTLDIGGGGGQMNLSDEQYKWLAYAISGEAGPGDDQYAVAASILNRVAEGRGTVEQVVKADGQYEAYHKGMMSMSPEIEARLKSAEGQARLVAALERLQGRTDFKGQTQLQNRVAGEDPMVDALGNFFHYSWQTGANSQMPSNYKIPNYQQFIKKANTGSDAALKNADIMQKWMQSIGGADQQANILGMNSTNASLAGLQMVTPTIVNKNYYTTGNQSSDDNGVINPGFNSMNLSAFTLPYSLAAKN